MFRKSYLVLFTAVALQLGSVHWAAAANPKCELALAPAKHVVIEVTTDIANGENASNGAQFPLKL